LGLAKGKEIKPTQIQTKDGQRIKVADPTRIYIDQAWVGKGLYGRTPDHRARGQIYMMKNPSTSKYLVLSYKCSR
jgi:ribosomal protein L22